MTDQKSNFEKVKEFQTVMDMERNKKDLPSNLMLLRINLIDEETLELEKEHYDGFGINTEPDRVKIAKEITDVLYVTYGMADAYGIDIDAVFDAVHLSNMSKLVDGKPAYREDGKVLKGPNYQPPDLSFINE